MIVHIFAFQVNMCLNAFHLSLGQINFYFGLLATVAFSKTKLKQSCMKFWAAWQLKIRGKDNKKPFLVAMAT